MAQCLESDQLADLVTIGCTRERATLCNIEISSCEVLLRRIALLVTGTVLPYCLLLGALILLKVLHLVTVHDLNHIVGLPFFEVEAESLVAVVLVICLVLVVFDLNEIGVDSAGVEGEGDQGINCGFLWDDLKGP